MPRKFPPCPSAPELRFARTHWELKIDVRLVTPMFGGGVQAGHPDPTTPVRGSAIRGQLRFWWRAICGSGFGSGTELRKRESAIWGDTDNPSPVTLEVRDVRYDASDLRPCAVFQWNASRRRHALRWDDRFPRGHLPYALFPFQGEAPANNSPHAKPKREPALMLGACDFRLVVRGLKSQRQDVEAALWAWVNFGGLGARTRRGCGALYCQRFAPKPTESMQDWLGRAVETHKIRFDSSNRPWSTWDGMFWRAARAQPTMQAWEAVISQYWAMRQEPGFARDPVKRGRPGRSRYPEPETIRELTGQHGHTVQPYMPHESFPRADFGLPIIFEIRGAGEPPKTTLNPVVDGEAGSRMASPLILKPLAVSPTQAIPVVLRLHGPAVQQIELTETQLPKGGSQPVSYGSWGRTAIERVDLATYPNSPLVDSTRGSAIEAFLLRLGAHGYQEVRA